MESSSSISHLDSAASKFRAQTVQRKLRGYARDERRTIRGQISGMMGQAMRTQITFGGLPMIEGSAMDADREGYRW